MSNTPTTPTPATATDKKQGNGQRPDRPPKLPIKWGLSEAKWMADQEDELITVHMRGGETLRGHLIGLDQFTIFVEHETTKQRLLVCKHAIDYMEPSKP